MKTYILIPLSLIWTLAFTPACSLKRSFDPPAEEIVANTQPPPLPAVTEKDVKTADEASKDQHATPAAQAAQPAHSAETVSEKKHSSAHDEHKIDAVPPETALKWLKNGNARFQKHSLRNDGQSKKDIQRLAKGQKPHTIVLSCSDSRVPPEVVFDQKLGEIFVVRTAGEALDSSAIASIEYAVAHLGSRLILAMGHTSCGAVKATLGTPEGSDAGSPALNSLVSDIRPRIKNFIGKTPSEGFAQESWANVKGVAKDLLDRSEIIRNKVKAGDVKITSAVYHLDDGKVEFE